MPEPKLTSYLNVDFLKLRDTQGSGPFENIPNADCQGTGTLLVIDMVPGAPWPHPCFWIGMRNSAEYQTSQFGMRPWEWPPKLRDSWDRSGPRPDHIPFEECPLMDTPCPVCGAELRETPSGSLCKNGHGGV